MKNNFKTKQEAEEYKIKHGICNMVPVYIECFKKWSLVFPVKTIMQKEAEGVM